MLITDLETVDAPNFTPDYFQPTIDQAANEQPSSTVGDAVFPSSLSKVSTAIDTTARTSRRCSPPASSATLARRERYAAAVHAHRRCRRVRDPDRHRLHGSDDLPQRGRDRRQLGRVHRRDRRHRAARDRAVQGSGRQRRVAQRRARAHAPSRRHHQWWGGAPTSSPNVEFLVEAVDQSGNVALSNNKVSNFLATKLVNSGALHVTLTPPAGVTPNNGWYHRAAGHRHGHRARRRDDAVQPRLARDPAVPRAASHLGQRCAPHPHVRRPDFAAADVSIDVNAPGVTSAIDAGRHRRRRPTVGHDLVRRSGRVDHHRRRRPRATRVSSRSRIRPPGALTIPSTTASSPPALTQSPLGTASTSVTLDPPGDGATTVSYSAVDVAGNFVAPGSATINIDRSAPVPTCTCRT